MANEQNHATMQLPMDLIAPAIQAHVNAAVIEALKGSDTLITKLITEIMGQKVDCEGRANGYRADIPWLTWAVQKIVREAVQQSIREHLARKESVIKAAIDAEMKKSGSKIVRALVDAMAVGMAEKFAESYRMNITFSPS